MKRLARTAFLAAAGLTVCGLAACGSGDPAPYVAGFSPPSFDSFRGGMTQPLTVNLSRPVVEKTYVNIEISATDQAYVSTNPADYIIFGAQTSSQTLNVIAKNVTAQVGVTLTFRMRDTPQEYRNFSFTIMP